MSTIRKTICIEQEIADKIEKMRKGRTQFVSGYINDLLRKEFGMAEKK